MEFLYETVQLRTIQKIDQAGTLDEIHLGVAGVHVITGSQY
jgi:hypothetical protein